MKKMISIFLSVLISVSSFSACSSSEEPESSSLSVSEQRKILNKNNKIAEYIYSAVNCRLASYYAEGKSIPLPGYYKFEIDKEAEDYIYINHKELGTSITTMSISETNTFLIYTASNFSKYADNPTDEEWPEANEGYIIVNIDESSNIKDVYFSDTEDGVYTGAYPISPTNVPSYNINNIPE